MLRRTTLAMFVALGGACGYEGLEPVGKEPAEDLPPSSNLDPVVSVVAQATTVAAGGPLGFAATAIDPDGTIQSFMWSFGDDTADDAGIDNGGGDFAVTHVFASPGSVSRICRVTFTVTDDGGSTGSDFVDIEVLPLSNTPPTVTVSAGLSEVDAGVAVPFTGTAQDADGVIVTWQWDFGDNSPIEGGSVSGDQSLVSHSFANSGTTALTYTVTLTVTDDAGATAAATYAIDVRPPPAPPTYDGRWSWWLDAGEPVDPSGWGLCPFQNSELGIQVSGGAITITEIAGAVQVPYNGTINGTAFSATHSGSLLSETIAGNFDSETTFSGTYTIDTGGFFPECETSRGIGGVKQ